MPDSGDLIEAVTAQPTRWGVGHLVLGVGIALMALLFFAVRIFLRDRNETTWSFWATPLVTVGLVLSGFMVGAEGVGGRSAVETGNVEAFFEQLEVWAIPIYLTANLVLGVGFLLFATAVAKSRILGTGVSWLVAVGAAVATVSLFLPVGWAAHAVSIGSLAFAWPLAYRIWTGPQDEAALA